ncbi:hypothetical protein MCOR02_001150 [Pyricularia oryzae]|nr:hypothetical protein MCOR02_001150 [Pyricularia oryzae]
MGIPRRMGQRRPNRCWGPRGRARAEKKSKRSTGDREQYAGFVEHFPSTEYVCCPAVGCFIYCLSSWSHFKPVAESILGLHFYRGRTDSSHQGRDLWDQLAFRIGAFNGDKRHVKYTAGLSKSRVGHRLKYLVCANRVVEQGPSIIFLSAIFRAFPTMGSTCWECGKYFPSGPVALGQHCQSTSHTECRRCYETFNNAQDRIDHEADQHAYCEDCDREFQSPNNARQHLNSRTHRGHSIQCPLCGKAYTTATGIVYHLESGSCPNAQNLSRDEVFRLVRSRDPQGVISKKLIGWTGDVEYEATHHAWNGYGYECYLCHRVFHQIHSLSQHLNSPALGGNENGTDRRGSCGF